MVRPGEVEHGRRIAEHAEAVWNWSSPAGRLRAQRRANLLAELAELGPGRTVLELGCGTGLFTELFAATGATVVAIDVSEDLLEQARCRQTWPPGIRFVAADAERLEFPAESFDAVIGSSVLHHCDLERALAEAFRVLKPGGRLAFAEPNMLNPQIFLQRHVRLLRELAGESPDETAFVRWKLQTALEQSGFEQVCIRPHDFLHPATPKPAIPLVRAAGSLLERLPLLREVAGSLLISARRSQLVVIRSQRRDGILTEWLDATREAITPGRVPLPG